MPLSPFTPIFNQTTDLVHINSTYINSNLPLTVTTPTIELFIIIAGIVLLFVSVIGQDGDLHQDIAGVFATAFLLIGAIYSFGLDTVTGYGMSSQIVGSQVEWVLIENHTIYRADLLGVVLTLAFVISCANLWRLWVSYHKVVSPVLPVADEPTMNEPQIPGHALKNRPDTLNRPEKTYENYDYQKTPKE